MSHMTHTYEQTDALTFLRAYNLDFDHQDLLKRVETEAEMFDSMKGKHGDEWMREWARSIHQTKMLFKDDPVILWCPRDDMIAWLTGEVTA